MRIAYLSDLHFEFHRDSGDALVAALDPTIADVLVVAGDLAVAEGIGPALDLLCERYAPRPVVYVLGNHELYGTTREAAIEITADAARRHANLRGSIVRSPRSADVGSPARRSGSVVMRTSTG